MVNIMSIIIPIVILVICLVGMVYCLIQAGESIKRLERNREVYSYRINLIDRCSPNVRLAEKIVDKYTYKEMLYSSKPLEDKYWFTPEEIEEINNNCISSCVNTNN